MSLLFRRCLLLSALLLAFPAGARAQYQIRTDHFYIYYDSGAEGTARRVADVAEEVFTSLASSFDFYKAFSRIHILVHDDEDFSNGFANYYENRVEIWASDLDFPYLRGTHEWIKLVVTHELAHIVSLKVASKGIVNAIVIQTGQFDKNPDFYLALPWLHLVAPNWYVEGIAQFADDQIGYEGWDTHRDMLLRMAVLEHDLLSYSQMGVFSHNSMHSEMVYNQGYALLRYIREQYGAGKAEDLTHHIGLLRFDPAIKRVLGISAKTLYRDWQQELRRRYGAQAHRIVEARLGPEQAGKWGDGTDGTGQRTVSDEELSRLIKTIDARFEGTRLVDGGAFDLHPAFSPDGKRLAYLSNEGSDYAGTDIWMLDLTTGRRMNTHQRSASALSWTPDGRSLIYGRRTGAFYDIYQYDVARKDARRLSAGLRVRDPAVSPDGKTIAFVRNQDGTTNLGLMNIDGTHIRYLTNNNDGTIYYTPRWSPDGRQLAFCVFRDRDRDIGLIDADSPTFIRMAGKKPAATDTLAFADTTRFRALIHSEADERDPSWLPDGRGLIFSSDRDGIFNLYEYSFESGAVRRRSDVLGGAFMPAISPDGRQLVYVGYHAANYSLYTLDRQAFGEPVALPTVARNYTSISREKKLSDQYEIGEYSRKLTISGIVPILSFSQTFIGNEFGLNSIDVGAEVSIGDILDKDRLFVRGSIGKNVRHAIDPNFNGTVFYERKLPPILSKNRSLAPSLYGVYDRSIIHNLRNLNSTFQDTLQVPLIVEFSNGRIDTVAGTQYGTETFRGRNTFKYDFNTYAIGLRLPLSSQQTVLMEYARRTYREGYDLTGPDRLQRQLFVGSQLLASLDTTITLSGSLLDNTNFFSSRSLLFYWDYRRVKPAVDRDINPSGGREITLWFNRIGSTVTDSLSHPTSRVIDGQSVPIQIAPNQFVPFVPIRRDLNLNEYGLAWTEFISLPIPRHTLSLSSLIRYRDKPLRESADGGGFYWPLRLYMGGMGTLSGYPYFTLEGSKVFLGRASYTFPVFPNIHRRLLFFYLDRLYLSGFWEGGTAWNFEQLTVDGLQSSRMLHDVGVQARMQVFSFYRIPMLAYAHVAFPLTDLTQRSRENLGLSPGQRIDRARFYFGLGFF